MSRDPQDYMLAALELARQGVGRTRPNPPVGSVVVRDGQVVGEGFHPRAGEPHAEIFALRDAGPAAEGSDLYVTLEPCCHIGKTGPCTEAVIAAGVKRVFVGTLDPNPKVSGKGVRQLEEAGIEVEVGLLEPECRELIAPFSRHMLSGMPLVVFKGAVTLDGFTATRNGDSRWVSGEKSRERVHQLRNRVDAIMVGIGTVLADDPLLTTRLERGGRNADRIVVDSRLQIPEAAAMLDLADGARTIVATTSAADPAKVERLQQRGVVVLPLPADADGRVDVVQLCRSLGQLDYQYIMLEGGARLLSSMWRASLVQRVQLYLAPKFYAGDDGIHLFTGQGSVRMADSVVLKNVRYEQSGEDLLVLGEVAECSQA